MDDSLSNGQHTQLLAGKEGSGVTAMDRAGELEREKVFVNLSRETIKQSPEYTEESLLTRDYEAGLHRHYNRQVYWVDELAAK